MGRKATRIEEQIEILSNRGLDFDLPAEKVKEILLDIGYYRLGFYWKPFEVDSEHNLKEGTKFSNVVELYYLDVDLRNLLNKYLSRFEINFRTKLIYYVSNKYKNSPTWFADPEAVRSEFLVNLESIYNKKFKSSNKVINRHHRKYINDKYAPAWKALEYFTFGTNLNLYRNLKDEGIQKRISECFGISNPEKFQNLVGAMLYLRNACAHGDVLFDLKLPQGMPNLSIFEFEGSDRQSLSACLKVLCFFIGEISESRKNDLTLELNLLFENNRKNIALKQIILEKMKVFDF